MLWAIVEFPGSTDGTEWERALRDALGVETRLVGRDATFGEDVDGVVLPGGTSYNDVPRPGAVASLAPVMVSVRALAESGKPVLGVGNGFQVLTEAGLLPGALVGNNHGEFRCGMVHVRIERRGSDDAGGRGPEVIHLPIAHGAGAWFCEPDELKRIEDGGQVLLRYCDASGDVTDEANPNGSAGNVAGIVSECGNVVGIMPRIERAIDSPLAGRDGRVFLESLYSTVGGGR
jgi:phosphoribosylformylglycinamidine synthase I